MFEHDELGRFKKGYKLQSDPRDHSKTTYRSKGIDKWMAEHEGKHFCECGCGSSIIMKKHHHSPSFGIPRFITGHLSKTAGFKEAFERRRIRGEKHFNWRGGITLLQHRLRKTPEYREWRTKVFERDHYKCQKCGYEHGNGKSIQFNAHHVVAFSVLFHLHRNDLPLLKQKLYDPSNGVTLCQTCHEKLPHPDIMRPKRRKRGSRRTLPLLHR